MESSKPRLDEGAICLKSKESEIDTSNEPQDQNNDCRPISRRHSWIHYRMRILKTAVLYVSFVTYGFHYVVLAPTIMHIKLLLDADLEAMSYLFTFMGVGFMVASVVCGLLFSRIIPELQLGVACIVLAILTIGAPWLNNYYIFAIVWTMQGVAMGYISTGGIAFCVSLWYNGRMRDPAMHGTNFVWSIGASVGPLILQPFIYPLNDGSAENINKTTLPNLVPSDINFNNMTLEFTDNFTINKLNTDVEFVRYGYMTIGILTVIPAVLYFILYFVFGGSRHDNMRSKAKTKAATPGKLNTRTFNMVTVIFFFLMFLVSITIESSLSCCLPAFVIEGLGWSVTNGALLSSVFWAGNCFGRVVGVPVSAIIKPRTMIAINRGLTIIASILIVIAPYTNPYVMWIAACTAGFSLATNYMSTVANVANYIEVTGTICSVANVGVSIGCIVGPAMFGYILSTYGHLIVTYFIFGGNVLNMVIFGLAELFPKLYRTGNNHRLTSQADMDIMENLK